MDVNDVVIRLANELGVSQDKLIGIDHETTLILLKKLELSNIGNIPATYNTEKSISMEPSQNISNQLLVELSKNDTPENAIHRKENFTEQNKIITELKDQTIELSTNVQILEEENAYNRRELLRKAEEISLLNTHKTWMESQIRKDTNEFIEYKEVKENELSKMSRKVIDVSDQIKLLLSTQKTLRSKNAELSSIVETTSNELKSVKDDLKLKESEFTKEMSVSDKMKQTLTEQLRNCEKQVKKNIENSTDAFDSHERDRLINDIALTKENLREYKEKCTNLQDMIDSFIANEENDSGSVPSTHNQSLNINHLYQEIEYLKRQLLRDRQQKEHLQRQLEIMIAEMETKMPLIESFKKRTEELEHQLLDTSDLLEKVSHQKTEISKELRINKKKQENKADNMKLLRIQRNDLARQVQFLLVVATHFEDSSSLFSTEELGLIKKIISNENENDYSDSQKVISNRLVQFKNIKELQQKNMDLLNSIRGLAKQLESTENGSIPEYNNNTIKEAKLAIIDLQNHANDLQDNVDKLTKECDSLRLLLPQEKLNNISMEPTNDSNEPVNEELIHLNEKFVNLEVKKNEKISELNSVIEKQSNSIHQLKLELEKFSNSKLLLQNHANDLERQVNNASKSGKSMKEELGKAQRTITEFQTNENANINLINNLNNKVSSQRLLQETSDARCNKLTDANRSLQGKYIHACEEKNELKIQIGELEIKLKTLEDIHTTSTDQYNTLKGEIELLSEQTSDQQQMLRELEEKRRTEVRWFQDESTTMNNKYMDSETTISKLIKENEDHKHNQIMLNVELQSLRSTHYNSGVFNIANSTESVTDQTPSDLSREKDSEVGDMTTQNGSGNYSPRNLDLGSKNRELILSLSVMKDQNISLKNRLTETQNKLEQSLKEGNHQPEKSKNIDPENLLFSSAEKEDYIIDHSKENTNILESQLSFAKEQLENISTQNDLLLEKLHKMESIADNRQIDDILFCLRHERDDLRKRVNILEREIRIQVHAASDIQDTNSQMNESQTSLITESHDELVNKIHEINLINHKNEELEIQLRNLTNEQEVNKNDIANLKDQLEPSRMEVQKLNEIILEKTQSVKLLQEESNRWKLQSMRLSDESKTNPNEIVELKQQINILDARINEKDLQSKEMDAKFARLKKQAHERLDSTKLVVNQLNDEISALKSEKEVIQLALEDKVSESGKMKLEIEELKKIDVSNRSKGNESNFSPNNASKEYVVKLEREIAYLNGKLELFDESTKSPDLINYLERLGIIKKQLQKDTISLTAGDQSDKSSDLMEAEGNLSIDKKFLDKEKEKWETETLKRIEEAKDDLKRHLRQPTEEKINRIIEKRKKELQENLEEMATEKAKSLILSKELNLTATEVKAELKELVESEMQESLEQLRKKSFEEGRQQELMKTKLLERKLSKLEGSQPTTTESANRHQESNDDGYKQIAENTQLGNGSSLTNFGLPVTASGNPFTFSTQSSNSSLGTFQTANAGSPFGNNKITNFTPIFGKPSTSFGNNNYKSSEIQNNTDAIKSDSDTLSKADFNNHKTSSSADSDDTVERPFKRSRTEEP